MQIKKEALQIEKAEQTKEECETLFLSYPPINSGSQSQFFKRVNAKGYLDSKFGLNENLESTHNNLIFPSGTGIILNEPSVISIISDTTRLRR